MRLAVGRPFADVVERIPRKTKERKFCIRWPCFPQVKCPSSERLLWEPLLLKPGLVTDRKNSSVFLKSNLGSDRWSEEKAAKRTRSAFALKSVRRQRFTEQAAAVAAARLWVPSLEFAHISHFRIWKRRKEWRMPSEPANNGPELVRCDRSCAPFSRGVPSQF